MTRVLLDTNALIWLMEQKDRRSLGKQASKIIEGASEVYASSISIVEIRIKTMLGKLKSRPDLLQDISRSGIMTLDFSAEQAESVQSFPQLARHDPFDRMLLAQAQAEGLSFITSDKMLLKLDLNYLVNARQ